MFTYAFVLFSPHKKNCSKTILGSLFVSVNNLIPNYRYVEKLFSFIQLMRQSLCLEKIRLSFKRIGFFS